jgi:Na+-driven multidrug efflux pump
MGEIPLASNAILLNFLMISGFFLDGLAQAAEQLCGKAVGANWRPAFDAAYALSFRWGALIAVGLALVWFAGGWFLIDFMTTSEPVRVYAREFLWIAALSSLTGMPAFLYDGILIGVTQNVVMRNGMLAALAVFLAAAFVLQSSLGNTGLWIAIHVFFVARAAYYWIALERRRALLFA